MGYIPLNRASVLAVNTVLAADLPLDGRRVQYPLNPTSRYKYQFLLQYVYKPR